MFNRLQKIGKALMMPIAVLPIAAILLRLGFGDIFTGDIAGIMKSSGEAIFSNLDLIFAIGIAYGLANDGDGASALSAGIGVLIAKSAYLQIDKDLNTGVFIGIIIGVVAGYIYNRFHTIKLPQFLGFFGGKRFVPILTSLVAIVIGILIGNFWHYVESGIEGFSNTIISLKEVGTFIYGFLNRLLIPLGLHHILNSIFWFQLGDYSYLRWGRCVANGDLNRFFAVTRLLVSIWAGILYRDDVLGLSQFGMGHLRQFLFLNKLPERKKAKQEGLGGDYLGLRW